MNQRAHGLTAGRTITVRGTGQAAIDGARAVGVVVDANHFTLPVTTGADAVWTSAQVGVSARLIDLPPGRALVEHTGFPGGIGSITLGTTGQAALDADHAVVEILDANRYRIAATTGGAGNFNGRVNGARVTVNDNGARCRVTHAGRGQGLGRISITGAANNALDGDHLVSEIVDANTYRLSFTTGAAFVQHGEHRRP